MTGRRKWIMTGGAGFIGANVTRALLERDFDVVVIDNLARPSATLNLDWLRAEANGSLTFIRADVRERERVDESLRRHADAEAILHLAGQVAVTTSLRDPREDFETNALGTFNVLEAARTELPDAVFLYVSSNKVYGSLDHHRIEEHETRYVDADFPSGIDESHALDPLSPYACSKAAGDLYALDYARVYGLRALSLRQSCIYGPRQFGIEDQGWVAWFAIAAVLGRDITIYGSGRQVRDLLHVDDLVELYLRAVERAEPCAGRAYNIGGGPANSLSLLELLAELEDRLSRPLAHRFAPSRTGDQAVFVADVSRARSELGWEPQVAVEDGLERLLEWVERNAQAAARVLTAA